MVGRPLIRACGSGFMMRPGEAKVFGRAVLASLSTGRNRAVAGRLLKPALERSVRGACGPGGACGGRSATSDGTAGNNQTTDIASSNVPSNTVNDDGALATGSGDPPALDGDTARTRAADVADGHTISLEYAVEDGPYDATCDKQAAAWRWTCHASIPYTPEAATAIGQDTCDLTIDVYNKLAPPRTCRTCPAKAGATASARTALPMSPDRTERACRLPVRAACPAEGAWAPHPPRLLRRDTDLAGRVVRQRRGGGPRSQASPFPCSSRYGAPPASIQRQIRRYVERRAARRHVAAEPEERGPMFGTTRGPRREPGSGHWFPPPDAR
jgi:hypothetical protein